MMIASNSEHINSNLFNANNLSKFVQIKYRLVVHAPTNVRLILTKRTKEKVWEVI